MKQIPSVTKLLQKVDRLTNELENLTKYVRTQQGYKGLQVTFYHASSKLLLFTKWSDQYYGSIENQIKESLFEYSYEVWSNGIHFKSFSEREPNSPWWQTKRSYYVSGEERTMRLIDIPNNPPPNYKGTMYLFHQEKIKEALSALPAWAIAVMGD